MGNQNDIKYGGGRYVCEKCGATVTGSALHHCDSNRISFVDMRDTPDKEPFVSGTCIGEKCSVCSEPATHKIGEEIPSDDPNPNRHNFTNYVCERHFNMVLRPYLCSQKSADTDTVLLNICREHLNGTTIGIGSVAESKVLKAMREYAAYIHKDVVLVDLDALTSEMFYEVIAKCPSDDMVTAIAISDYIKQCLSAPVNADKWVSVKEKMPEDDSLVIVWFCKGNHLPDLSYGYEEFAYWTGKIWEKRNSKSGIDMESNQDMRIVTHWQRCPIQPKK